MVFWLGSTQTAAVCFPISGWSYRAKLLGKRVSDSLCGPRPLARVRVSRRLPGLGRPLGTQAVMPRLLVYFAPCPASFSAIRRSRSLVMPVYNEPSAQRRMQTVQTMLVPGTYCRSEVSSGEPRGCIRITLSSWMNIHLWNWRREIA